MASGRGSCNPGSAHSQQQQRTRSEAFAMVHSCERNVALSQEDTSESFAVKSHSFHEPKPPGCGWLLGGRRAKDTPSRALDGALADEVAWRRAERVSETRALSRQTTAQVDSTGSSFVSDAVRCTHPWRVFVVRLRRSFISWRTCNHVTILCSEEWSPTSVPVPALVPSGTGMEQRVQKTFLCPSHLWWRDSHLSSAMLSRSWAGRYQRPGNTK